MSQKVSKLENPMKNSASDGEKHKLFSDEELAAMKERANELKSSRSSKARLDGEAEVLAKIAELQKDDRAIAERLHAIVKANAPELSPKTWYGMPAYAIDGKVVCFFQGAGKFKTRYSTLGFNDPANLDDGSMWPVAFAITVLTDAEEAKIIELLRRAIG